MQTEEFERMEKFFEKYFLRVLQKHSIFASLLRKKHLVLVPWCNGSTGDFGSLGLGSNPSGTTNKQKSRKSDDLRLFCF